MSQVVQLCYQEPIVEVCIRTFIDHTNLTPRNPDEHREQPARKPRTNRKKNTVPKTPGAQSEPICIARYHARHTPGAKETTTTTSIINGAGVLKDSRLAISACSASLVKHATDLPDIAAIMET